MLRLGPQALTDAELLAILLRIGFQGTSAVELGRNLVKEFGSLRAVAEAPLIALRNVKGLQGTSGAKASQLAAALEINKNVTQQKTKGVESKIRIIREFKIILDSEFAPTRKKAAAKVAGRTVKVKAAPAERKTSGRKPAAKTVGRARGGR